MAKQNYTTYLKDNLFRLSDLVTLGITLLVIALNHQILGIGVKGLLNFIAIALITNIFIWLTNPKQNTRSWSYNRHIFESFKMAAINLVVFSLINLLFFHNTYGNVLLTYVSVLFTVNLVVRNILNILLRHIRSRGFNYRRVIYVGSPAEIRAFNKELLEKKHYGYRMLASFNEKLEQVDCNINTPSDPSSIYDCIIDGNIDELFVSNQISGKEIQSLITFCSLNGVVINITHHFLSGLKLEPLSVSINQKGVSTTITIKEELFSTLFRNEFKRLLDVLLAVAVILFLATWLFPITGLFIRLSSKGPVFFVQKRNGLNNTVFNCYKFRTMRLNTESDIRQAAKNDARITKIGKFLRWTNLDELPQIFNVLKGEMSIVGPRPHMLLHTQLYADQSENYLQRLWVKPGITGLAQSQGYRGEISSKQQLEGRISRDIEYMMNWSFLLDLKIIWQTGSNMIRLKRMGA
ncbi:MAG: exopolysaccharide biosynthesis polyprenyl glycosylphosphotransferase [Bacteroidetes bacterium]|nr:exopolysaccharide biosynthesis polyprenyl glycosylphosphotransferase [Bacteroidota bacterium]